MKENKTIIIILTICAFILGLGVGYQYRGTIPPQTFRVENEAPSSLSMDIDTLPLPSIVEIAKGQVAHLATIDIQVLDAKRETSVTELTRTVKTAPQGTEFLVVRLKVKNTTKQAYSYTSYNDLVVDNTGRQFSSSQKLIFVDDLLTGKQLNPSIDVEGVILFEIPSDAQGLFMPYIKAGTGDVYQLNLE